MGGGTKHSPRKKEPRNTSADMQGTGNELKRFKVEALAVVHAGSGL